MPTPGSGHEAAGIYHADRRRARWGRARGRLPRAHRPNGQGLARLPPIPSRSGPSSWAGLGEHGYVEGKTMPVLGLGAHMRRRDFLGALGGAAVAWPLAARAQQPERMRRIGVPWPRRDDPEGQARVARSCKGWRNWAGPIGRNVRIDFRWAGTMPTDIRRDATELVALAPDVILADGNATVAPLLQATRTVPIVFRDCRRPGRRRLCR